jgi:hypothetical protein
MLAKIYQRDMMMKKPLFWVAFAALSVAAAFAAWNLFPKAFPILTVDITMDRQMAVDRASELSERFGWGPDQARMAANYVIDTQVQNYIELEGGGAAAYRELLEGNLYSPYTWRVRAFQESEVQETEVRFTPGGEPYGFAEKLSQDLEGAALDAVSAQAIAEFSAAADWGIIFSDYTSVESSEDLQPSGRLDHTFVYERNAVQIGEATIRLRLVVSGDRLSALTHFVRIPEAFDRKFNEMRADNTTLSAAASTIMFLVFFGGGCVFGLFFLIRRNAVIWRQPLMWGAGIALLNLLAGMSAWPLQWMGYDTAVSIQNHVATQLISALAATVGMALFFSVIFMAAESLSRLAFPKHIQLWKIWSREAVSTRQVLGLTLCGLFLVSFDLLYVMGTYVVTSSQFGWWYPSSSLMDPNILSLYFPWITAIAIPLQAAFMEEALFRAVPIAAAVLLGRRFGAMPVWISAAFILQAVVFGAAHADYPQMPFYARTLELILPALFFGAIFYYLGLFPAILLHFWYNVVWFSVPIFSSQAPGIWIDKTLLVFFALLPLWIILVGRLRYSGHADAPDSVFNAAWRPDARVEPVSEEEPATEISKSGLVVPSVLNPLVWKASGAAAAIGVALLLIFSDFSKDVDPLQMSRPDAIKFATEQLAEHGATLPEGWRPLAQVIGSSESHTFVWREGGSDAYQQLNNSYLHPPRWDVRFVGVGAPVEDRAEEYQLRFSRPDVVTRYRMILPEDRAGATLTETEARELAEAEAMSRFGYQAGSLQLISATESSRPARTDWRVVFADIQGYPLERGQAHIAIYISGDLISGYERFVDIPEEWTREIREQQSTISAIRIGSTILITILGVGVIVTAIVRWARRDFDTAAFTFVAVALTSLAIVDSWNSWPVIVHSFNTVAPWTNQLYSTLAGMVIGLLLLATLLGLCAGLIRSWKFRQPLADISASPVSSLILAAGPVLLIAGLRALYGAFTEQTEPSWGLVAPGAATFPVLAGLTGPFQSFMTALILLGILFGWIHQFSNGWTRRRISSTALLMLAGFTLAVMGSQSVAQWITTGLIVCLVFVLAYVFILRHQIALIIPAAGLQTMIQQIDRLVSPMYPGAAIAAFLSICLVGVASWWLYRFWIRTYAVSRG